MTKVALTPAQILVRNEQSKICKQKKKASALGITLEEYQASLVKLTALTEDEIRLRRNMQSRISKAKKRGIVVTDTVAIEVVEEVVEQEVVAEPTPAVEDKIEAVIGDVEHTAPTKSEMIKIVRMANLAKANAAKKAKREALLANVA